MPDQYILTQEGYDRLKEEHQGLIENKRPKAIERVKKAREMGSLDDNPEYDAARQEQGLIEKRILELDEILKNHTIANYGNEDFVVIGSTVIVEVESEIDEFTIVSSFEADPAQGKISNESPVGQSLLGAKIGDVVEVATAIVRLTYKVLEIK